MKKASYQQVIDAIRKNGLPKTKGTYILRNNKNIPIGGCALGQAALNLDASLPTLMNSVINTFWGRATSLNDDTDLTLTQIADQLEIDFKLILKNEILIG